VYPHKYIGDGLKVRLKIGWLGFDRRDEMVAIAPGGRREPGALRRRPAWPPIVETGADRDPELRGSGIHRCWLNNGRPGGGRLKATSGSGTSVVPQTPAHDQSE
jgi:hypothetical protein